jgi:hypothetical protein
MIPARGPQTMFSVSLKVNQSGLGILPWLRYPGLGTLMMSNLGIGALGTLA